MPDEISPEPEVVEAPQAPAEPIVEHATYFSQASLAVAVVWAIAAVIFASILLTGATNVEYGGDAYTGIQNAVNLAVRGIAFLLFGSAALGIVIAIRRDRH
jgi:hypothetical protein